MRIKDLKLQTRLYDTDWTEGDIKESNEFIERRNRSMQFIAGVAGM